jgi:hypothetical protein
MCTARHACGQRGVKPSSRGRGLLTCGGKRTALYPSCHAIELRVLVADGGSRLVGAAPCLALHDRVGFGASAGGQRIASQPRGLHFVRKAELWFQVDTMATVSWMGTTDGSETALGSVVLHIRSPAVAVIACTVPVTRYASLSSSQTAFRAPTRRRRPSWRQLVRAAHRRPAWAARRLRRM